MRTTILINTNSVDRSGNIFHKDVLQQIINQAQDVPVYYKKGEHQEEILVGTVERATQIREGIPEDYADERVELEIKLEEFSESDNLKTNRSKFIESFHLQIIEKIDKKTHQEITKARLMGLTFEPLMSAPGFSVGFQNL